MTQKIGISLNDRTLRLIEERKGGLGRSEYIQECILNYWEHLKINRGKKNANRESV